MQVVALTDRGRGHGGRPAPARQGLSGISRELRRPARRSRTTKCRSAGSTTAPRRSRSPGVSRRKNSSSPGFFASTPLGRLAGAQLPEVRPSRVRVDGPDSAHRCAACVRVAPPDAAARVLPRPADRRRLLLRHPLLARRDDDDVRRAADAGRRPRRGAARRLSVALSRCVRRGRHAASAVAWCALGDPAARRRSGWRPSSAASTSGTAFPGRFSATAR